MGIFSFFFFSQGIHSCWKAGFPSIRTSVWLWKYESPESGSSLLQLEQPLCCWKPGGQVLPMASRIPSWPRRQWLGKRKAERTGKDGTSTALSHGWNPGMASLSTCPLSRTVKSCQQQDLAASIYPNLQASAAPPCPFRSSGNDLFKTFLFPHLLYLHMNSLELLKLQSYCLYTTMQQSSPWAKV